jgi:hypothetical protein
MLRSNKSYTLYGHEGGSYVVSLASNPSGTAVICGHMDGSLFRCAWQKRIHRWIERLQLSFVLSCYAVFGEGALNMQVSV